eukprot:UN24455
MCGRTNRMSLVQLQLLSWLSANMQDPFFDPRLLDRVVTMVDSYLKKLTVEQSDLKVKNADEVAFKPRKLLECIVSIFNHLADSNNDFLIAVSKEEAFYTFESYKKTTKILRKHNFMSEKEITKFWNFTGEVEKLRKQYKNIEVRLGEIPDKYLDAMLYTLMRDPVELPTSPGIIMDRSKIQIHLLNNHKCPFTRKPLTVDQLIPK